MKLSGRGKVDITYKSGYTYNMTIEDYNNYGWVRANDIVNSGCWKNFERNYAEAKKNKDFDLISDLGEYMIEVYDENLPEPSQTIDTIIFAKGKIESPEITRIVKIDAYNNTDLSDISEDLYEAERQGLQTKTEGIFEVYYATDYGLQLYELGSIKENARNNNQLGADRGTGSGTAQRVKEEIPENLGHYQVVEKFKDANGKSRKIRRLGKKYMVEDTKKRVRIVTTTLYKKL